MQTIFAEVMRMHQSPPRRARLQSGPSRVRGSGIGKSILGRNKSQALLIRPEVRTKVQPERGCGGYGGDFCLSWRSWKQPRVYLAIIYYFIKNFRGTASSKRWVDKMMLRSALRLINVAIRTLLQKQRAKG